MSTSPSVDRASKSIRFIDLFAGCGGLSEGFIQAGYAPVAHVEMNEVACFTLKTRMAYHWLKKNGKLADYCIYLRGEISREGFYEKIPSQILDSVINEEVGEKTLESLFNTIDIAKGEEAIDLIVGGPPCQAYSLVGRASDKKHMKGDPRNYLFKLISAVPRHFFVLCVLTLRRLCNPENFREVKTSHLESCGYKYYIKENLRKASSGRR